MTGWRKSSYSGGESNDCVEVASGDKIGVRDTKDRDGVTLTFGIAAWEEFVTGLRRS